MRVYDLGFRTCILGLRVLNLLGPVLERVELLLREEAAAIEQAEEPAPHAINSRALCGANLVA